jgi:5-methylcytosine-specific restriction enzyme A
MALKRPCLGCGRLGRWRHRCPRCQAEVDRRQAQARPDLHDDAAERRRRARAVTDHRATVGDWCPGVPELGRRAHPAASLSADHVIEVATGGDPAGPLVVRCIPCNAARSANVVRRAVAELGGSPQANRPTTPRHPKFPTHTAPEPPPRVVA